MSVRPPSILNRSEQVLNVLEYEFLAEKAAALGRAGDRVGEALGKLNAHDAANGGDAEARRVLLKVAADAVYAYFIQRELCGLRRHDDAIRDYAIPKEVLLRLGAA